MFMLIVNSKNVGVTNLHLVSLYVDLFSCEQNVGQGDHFSCGQCVYSERSFIMCPLCMLRNVFFVCPMCVLRKVLYHVSKVYVEKGFISCVQCVC